MSGPFLPVSPQVTVAVADMQAGIRWLRTGSEACRRVAGRLEAVLSEPGRGGSVLEALGLDPPAGTAPHWQVGTAPAVRLRLIADLAKHFPGHKKVAWAKAIANAAADYETRKWPLRRGLTAPPAADSEVDQLHWRLMRNGECGARWPIRARQLVDEMQRAGVFIAKAAGEDGCHERSPLQPSPPQHRRRAGAAD